MANSDYQVLSHSCGMQKKHDLLIIINRESKEKIWYGITNIGQYTE
jgi:hypothetical protein